MITLQDLIDFAKAKKLDPKQCVLFLGEECADGNVQHDYLYKLRVKKNVETINHKDEEETVPIGLVIEILPW